MTGNKSSGYTNHFKTIYKSTYGIFLLTCTGINNPWADEHAGFNLDWVGEGEA